MILTIHYQLVKLLRVGLKIFMLLLTLIEANLLPWYYLDPTTGIMQTGWQYLGNKWTTSVPQEQWPLAGIRKVPLGII